MRSYPENSPQAAARVLSLAMLVDGGLDLAESRYIRHSGVLESLGIDDVQFDAVVEAFCNDMLQSSAHWSAGRLSLNPAVIDAVLSEIDDPRIRLRLLDAIVRIAGADGRVTRDESDLIARAVARWASGLEH